MKKYSLFTTICAIVLILSFLLSLTACGKKTPDSSGGKESSSSSGPDVSYGGDDAAVNKKPLVIPDGMSIDAVMVGDENFTPGSLYKLPTISFRKQGDDATLGLWCWDTGVLIRPERASGLTADMLLDMMIANNVSELYLSLGRMLDLESQIEQEGVIDEGYVSEMQVRGFIKKCNKYGIRVAALLANGGDSAVNWMKGNYGETMRYIAMVESMNSRAKEDEKIYGIHIDIEPQWKKGAGMAQNQQWAAEYFTAVRKACDRTKMELNFDIYAWMNKDDMVIDENGKKVAFLDLLTQKCHALTIMSYRPKAADQYSIAADEVEFAAKNDCRIILASETMNPKDLSAGEAGITYYRVGAQVMDEQMGELRTLLDNSGAKYYGGAIHHAASWYAMVREKP